MFDPDVIIAGLESNRGVFEPLLAGRSPAQQRWRPAPEKWSLLEIVCHLYDEERDDFRTRVRHTLESSPGSPPSVDPDDWVQSRRYAERDYDTQVAAFLGERDVSVAWLRSLRAPDWDRAWQHPQLGRMTARAFLANWLAHDALHQRQIVRYDYFYLKETSREDLGYAGQW
jgi:hypothetical protein